MLCIIKYIVIFDMNFFCCMDQDLQRYQLQTAYLNS